MAQREETTECVCKRCTAQVKVGSFTWPECTQCFANPKCGRD